MKKLNYLKTAFICAIAALMGTSGITQPLLPPVPPSRNTTQGSASSATMTGGSSMMLSDSASLNPPSGTNTNNGGNTNSSDYAASPSYSGIMTMSGDESLLIDTFPTVLDPTQIFPSWATIHSGGLAITTNGLVDTNVLSSYADGMPLGSAVGVVIVSSLTNAFTITRGDFPVLLTNSSGELSNTRFEVKIMRNTNDFTDLFHQEMALAEYETNSPQLTLTSVTNSANTNLYILSVQFPACLLAAPRVISIRTEPMDFDLPYAQLQWLVGSGTSLPATYTTDQTSTNLLLQSSCPALRLWGANVNGVGLTASTCLTPQVLHVFTIPGTVITASILPSGGFQDSIWPDAYGFGNVDASQSSMGFFGVRVDADP